MQSQALPHSWNAEKEKNLRALWLDGVPAKVIAEQIRVQSRHAVIGKARRMGLPAHVNGRPHNSTKPTKLQQKNYELQTRRLNAITDPKYQNPCSGHKDCERFSFILGGGCYTHAG